MASRRAACLAACAAACVWAAPAVADPSDRDRETARALDLEAEQAILEGKLDKALSRYERSAELVDVPAHWLMIGRLRAQLGRPASALVALERASRFPLRPGAPPAQKRAADRARAELEQLRPRVPTLTVRVIGATPSEVTIDGVALDLASLDEPHPLDPGSHRVVARSTGRPPAVAQQTLSAGEQTTLELRFIEGPATQGAAPAAASGGGAVTAIGYVALGVGGLGVLAGAITGLATLSRASQLANDCPRKAACPAEDQTVIDQGRALGTASTATFAVGGASLVTGVVLLVVGKRSATTAPPTTATLIPWLGPGAGGLRGTF